MRRLVELAPAQLSAVIRAVEVVRTDVECVGASGGDWTPGQLRALAAADVALRAAEAGPVVTEVEMRALYRALAQAEVEWHEDGEAADRRAYAALVRLGTKLGRMQ